MHGNLSTLLQESAHRFPDETTLAAGGLRVQYAELDAWVDGVAALIEREKLAGQRLGQFLPNHPLLPVALYGLLRAGSAAVPVNPMYSPREAREVERALEQTRASAGPRSTRRRTRCGRASSC